MIEDEFGMPQGKKDTKLTEAEQVEILKAWTYPRLIVWLVGTVLGGITLFVLFSAVLLAFKLFGG